MLYVKISRQKFVPPINGCKHKMDKGIPLAIGHVSGGRQKISPAMIVLTCQIPLFFCLYMKNETDAKSSVIDTNVTKRQPLGKYSIYHAPQRKLEKLSENHIYRKQH